MNVTLRRITLGLAMVASLGGLTACVPLLVGGAVMGGGMVATDRRTSGSVLEDEGIELRASSRVREGLGERVHINITSYNRQVLITGEVPNAQDKQLVEKIVSGVDNVRNIVNELAIMGNSTLTQRSSDTLVTGRVKAALVDAKDLFSSAFKISTERGTTYVMGRVTQREADRATEVITRVSGVQRLVRMFEIISEDELARTLPQQPPADPKK
ncbi:BON domain-containing protein [Rhodoferax saidenbachensis]|uniref:Transporter n=1 Tax=Rhodoferax saidenbachensis TaxID=1484693 RepID=A0A1P8K5Y1_9BURK|nr:BON domain-containing protein [Rhodoferax saidenbachensis]APW41423.1 transporter [Rhodoferax saidenbachensis]